MSTTVTSPPTLALAEYGLGLRLADLPSDVRERAKLLVLDTVGVGFAAFHDRIGQIIVEYVREQEARPIATVIGSGLRTAPPLAALANGTLTAALDFDAGFHLTTHVVPAALAAGELRQASGAQVLEAIVAGYEVGTRLTEMLDADRAAGGGVTANGWYHVGLVAPLVCAIAASKLFGMTLSQTATAIGIAATGASGVRRNFGMMAKQYQAGNGASQGVQAASLALKGFTGDPAILEAPLGLFAALGVDPVQSTREPLRKLGNQYELRSSLRIKRFPACTPAHPPVQALLEAKRQYGFEADDVEWIDADLHTFSLLRLDPADEVEAGFSLPYLLSAALVYGELTLEQLSPERVRDTRIRAVMPRVRGVSDSVPSGREEGAETVTVHLRDGRIVTGQATRVDRLEAVDDIRTKFRTCAGLVLQPSQAERLEHSLLHMEECATIAEVMADVAPRTE